MGICHHISFSTMDIQKHYASIWEQKWTKFHIAKFEHRTVQSTCEGKKHYAIGIRIPNTVEGWNKLKQHSIETYLFCLTSPWNRFVGYNLTIEYSRNINSTTDNSWDFHLTDCICTLFEFGQDYSTHIIFKFDSQIFVAIMILPILIASIHEQMQTDMRIAQTMPTNVERTFFDCYLVKNIIDRIRF